MSCWERIAGTRVAVADDLHGERFLLGPAHCGSAICAVGPIPASGVVSCWWLAVGELRQHRRVPHPFLPDLRIPVSQLDAAGGLKPVRTI